LRSPEFPNPVPALFLPDRGFSLESMILDSVRNNFWRGFLHLSVKALFLRRKRSKATQFAGRWLTEKRCRLLPAKLRPPATALPRERRYRPPK
jgi:hypothetical protein